MNEKEAPFKKRPVMVLCSVALWVIGLALLVIALSSSFVLRDSDMPGGLMVIAGMLTVFPLGIYSYFAPQKAGKLLMVSMVASYLGLFASPGQYTDILTHALIVALLLSPAFLIGWVMTRLSQSTTKT